MTSFYLFQGCDHLCETCADPSLPGSEDDLTGPFPSSQAEADYPIHCSSCTEHLENPLTDDGVKYVLESCLNRLWKEGKLSDVEKLWLGYYRDEINDYIAR